MSVIFDNSITVDDILAEFHRDEQLNGPVSSERDYNKAYDNAGTQHSSQRSEDNPSDSDYSRDYSPKHRSDNASEGARGLGRMDFSMDRVHKDIPEFPEPEAKPRRVLPSEEEIRAYTASALAAEDYLDIAKDIDNSPKKDTSDAEPSFRVEGSKAPSSFVYDGEEVDVGSADDYIPSVQEVHLNLDERSEPFAGFRRDSALRRGKTSVRRRKNAPPRFDDTAVPPSEDDSQGFREYTSYSIPLAGEGISGDYSFEGDSKLSDEDSTLFPSTFKGYLVSVIATVLYKLRPNKRGEYNGDEVENEEELGKELSPKEASRYYGSFIKAFRLRLRVGAVLWLFMLWLSSGLPVLGALKNVSVAAIFCVALQFTVMLLCLDVVSNALTNIAIGKIGADFLAVFACILTSIDGFMVAKSSSVSPHLPLCVLSTLSLLGVSLASLLNVRSLRKVFRVPAIAKAKYAVTSEKAVQGMGFTLLKSSRPISGFVRRAEEAPLDEGLYTTFTPFILISALLLSCILSAIKGAFSDFLYIFSTAVTASIPFASLLSFALPYFIGSMRIFNSGAAIAGWSGLCDVGESKDLIITDIDLFPKGTVELESVRIFADTDADKIISFAGSLIAPSGMAISPCFIDLMRSTSATKMRVENIEFLPAGGVRGIIQGERVLCGNVDLMRLMNVRVPGKLVDKNSVLLAVDGVLYGIFNIRYTPLQKVRAALTSLMKSNRQAVFAIRDFNVTPEMLREAFDIATDGYSFPPYLERFRISAAKADSNSKISAVVCRESLGPLVDMADAGRSMYLATNINTGISLSGSVICLLSAFIRLLTVGNMSIMQLFVILLLFSLPIPIVSFVSIAGKQQ